MGDTVLLTGAAGQIGAHLGRFLRQKDYTVTALDLNVSPEGTADESLVCDILDPDTLHRILGAKVFSAVIRLAAAVAPTELPDELVFRTNVTGTYNILRAVRLKPGGRIVYMSSESVLGFAFAKRPLKPAFVPIDETHPLRAHDAYGLSKLLGEKICEAYHLETGAPVISLRPPWVWIPEKIERYKSLIEHPEEWAHGLWAYVAIEDLCEAVYAALTANADKFPLSLFIAAEDNGTRVPSTVLLERFYGFRGPYRPGFEGCSSVISPERAYRLLAWKAQWGWREWMVAHGAALTGESET
ncbi:MAG: NAD-dependent epimerase/dehydratase family protein [Moorellales bacterium]